MHPEVLEDMAEFGVDTSGRRPARLTDALAERADVVVTIGRAAACPSIPGTRDAESDLQDPKRLPIGRVRAIREDVAGRIDALVEELDTA